MISETSIWVPFGDSGRRGTTEALSRSPSTPLARPATPVSFPGRKSDDSLLLLDLRRSGEEPASRVLEFRAVAAMASSIEVVNVCEAVGRERANLVQRRHEYRLYGNRTPTHCLFGDHDGRPSQPLAGET